MEVTKTQIIITDLTVRQTQAGTVDVTGYVKAQFHNPVCTITGMRPIIPTRTHQLAREAMLHKYIQCHDAMLN